MQIGIPKEIKPFESRVSLLPAAVSELTKQGHVVDIEMGAGLGSGYTDADYIAAGATIASDAASLYERAELIVKVKEPVTADLAHLHSKHILFCYLHLAALPQLTRQLQDIGLTAIGFETLEVDKSLPLLAPMSDIAGRLAAQIGAQLLQKPHGGKGLLLGGLPGAERGQVVILGGGVAGSSATLVSAALGAQVTVFDRNRDKLLKLHALGANVTGLYSYADAIAESVRRADVLIGAILVTGQRATKLVSEQMVKTMQAGSVIIDIAVDQGGCIETTHPTDYRDPTFIEHDVLHFGVTNMPGAVPRSASQALSAALYPWVSKLASVAWREDEHLISAINVDAGKICHPGLKNHTD